jgi:hypothetical protein
MAGRGRGGCGLRGQRCQRLFARPYQLDGREVPIITAFLFHARGDDDPEVLEANSNKSFQGSIVLGMGFTFDDTDTRGIANPIALKDELIARDRRNAERIFPYICDEEVNEVHDKSTTAT